MKTPRPLRTSLAEERGARLWHILWAGRTADMTGEAPIPNLLLPRTGWENGNRQQVLGETDAL